ncbi:MAG: FecR domain-containing protein [Acidimicrobiia bacterium]
MHEGTERREGRPRRRGRALRGLATLVMAVGSVAMIGASAAHAADKSSSKSSGTVLATLKLRASSVVVKAKGASSYVAAKDGQSLKQGDALKTDATGLAEIDYTDGSLTRLGVSTEFEITKLTDNKGARQTQGTLTVGSTWNRAAKVSESGEFSIKAGGATAAVEGTAFVVTCPTPTSGPVSCSITAIVDNIGVNSDEWNVTSVTDAH